MKNFCPSLEKFLVGIIVCMFAVPGLLTIVAIYCDKAPAWLRNANLAADAPPPMPAFSRGTYFDAKYQQMLAAHFEATFAGREILIRITNEICFRVFHYCPLPSTSVMIGRNNELFQDVYLSEYCIDRTKREKLVPIAGNLKRFQDECRRRGIAFVMLITPNKASVQPENIPPVWMKRYNPLPRTYDLLVPLLREQGIFFVDGRALAMDIKNSSPPVPVFPQGGIHWGDAAVLASTNAILTAMTAQGKPVKLLEGEMRYTTEHARDSADLISILNLAIPWKYTVADFVSKPVLPRTKYNIVGIGGSFTWRIFEMLQKSRQFAELDDYAYYNVFKRCWVDDETRFCAQPVKQIDFSREIYAADCVILEVNELMMGKSDNNLIKFLPDALGNLPPENKPREKFLSGMVLPCEWGKWIDFKSMSPQALIPAWLSGFSSIEPQRVFMGGREGLMRLETTPSGRDVILEAVAGVSSKSGGKQSATIFVNDEPVGHWVFSPGNESTQSLTIPAKLTGSGGNMVIRFHLDNSPDSPEKSGPSFSAVRLVSPGRNKKPVP